MNEKCPEPCAGLARLEGQIRDLRRQNGEDHRELRERLGGVETTNAVQNAKYDAILEKLDALGRKVDALEAKPGRRWESLTEKAVWALAAAVIAFLLGKVGL